MGRVMGRGSVMGRGRVLVMGRGSVMGRGRVIGSGRVMGSGRGRKGKGKGKGLLSILLLLVTPCPHSIGRERDPTRPDKIRSNKHLLHLPDRNRNNDQPFDDSPIYFLSIRVVASFSKTLCTRAEKSRSSSDERADGNLEDQYTCLVHFTFARHTSKFQ